MKFYAEINKVDEETRMVYGYASTEALDSQGEVVKIDAMKAALADYMKFANIREMHQPSAVGVAKEASLDAKGLWIGAKVVDDDAWKKVTEKVYKGFSIGGKVLERDAVAKNVITGIRLSEISLVDRPANPEALFEVFKAERTPEDDVEELAAVLDKGTVSPGELLKLAQAEIMRKAKLDTPVVTKGMMTVAWAADILQSLNSLQQSTEYEAADEGDGSTMPDRLKTFVAVFASLLNEIVAEETAEIVGSDDVAMAARVESLAKAHAGRCQKMHDMMAAQGAKCMKDDEGNDDADMAETISSLSKALDVKEGEKLLDTLTKVIADRDLLKAENDKLKALPVPPKGALKVVEKGEDTEDLTPKVDNNPVTKADGTIDPQATAMKLIKNAHKSGGIHVPLGR